MLVACLTPVPLIAALVLDASSTVLLAGAIGSGLVLVVASLVRAIHRARRQRRDFEDRLASWAAERAVAEERLRIARDLHDISSHGLGIITVRAAASGYLEGPDADTERRRAMLDIERVSRNTTTELRRMLTVLRTAGDTVGAPLHPAETLADLPGIVRDAERHGLIVQAEIVGLALSRPALEPIIVGGDQESRVVGDDQKNRAEGDQVNRVAEPCTVPQGVQVAVCAIVREALTNVLRHAGPTTVRLSVARSDGTIQVVVDDDGQNPGHRHQPWPAEPESGARHGLTGVRERVKAYGGTLAACPTRQGFRVHASIPIGADL